MWPRVLAIAGSCLFVLAVAAAAAAWVLYNQALAVKDHETKALASLNSISSLTSATKTSTVKTTIASASANADEARSIAHGRLWNIAARIPVIGGDVSTVQGMTSVMADVVGDTVPRLVDVASTLQNATLSTGDATINLSPILASQKEMTSVSTDLAKLVDDYDSLATPRTSKVRTAYLSGKTSLESLDDTVSGLSDGLNILPDFLGSDGAKTYAILAMTTSEARSSGGLVGSVGEMKTQDGAISISDFRSNTEYLPYSRAQATSDEKRLFSAWGPLSMSFDIRDSAVYPDTSRVASAMKTMWTSTPWGSTTTLDGVILVDPVVLQELVGATGNITLPDGRVLTGSNTAKFLLNTVYTDYKISEQDELFGLVAERAVSSAFSNMTFSKLVTIGKIMGSMAQGRHLSVYAFDTSTQKTIAAAGLTASSPDNEEKPSVGVYLTQQSASKMDWYVHRTSRVVRKSCNSNGSQTYQVSYTMKNTITSAQASSLSSYITGY
ncbi:DUF4012 domain-containing protein, partial [uncultured Bifidobacterium sp.]|uniref:DUF4012 domain-containing protein n=1 Tax=uncultured Bifidobacterium sp. TaxID=165187 RepID=UPI00262C934F